MIVDNPPFILFALAGLFAIAAVIAKQHQSERKPVERNHPARSEPKRLADRASSTPGIVTLSNHGAHMLEEVAAKRRASEEAIKKHRAILEELSIDEAKITSGLAGESALDDLLHKHLGGDWTIIAGYRAQEGEIDRILVGPGGVFAFEVKNLSGIIHCDGDRWWRDKTDRRGNITERDISIADNGGRSPSRQVNDAADALERLLSGNGHDVRIVRVVVFTHTRAEIGKINSLTVDAVALGRWPDIKRVLERGGPLSEDQVRKIATTIRRHHEWFERKVRQPSSESRFLNRASLPAS